MAKSKSQATTRLKFRSDISLLEQCGLMSGGFLQLPFLRYLSSLPNTPPVNLFTRRTWVEAKHVTVS